MTATGVVSIALLGSFFISDFYFYRILSGQLLYLLNDLSFRLRDQLVNRESILRPVDFFKVNSALVSCSPVYVFAEIAEVVHGRIIGGNDADASAHLRGVSLPLV